MGDIGSLIYVVMSTIQWRLGKLGQGNPFVRLDPYIRLCLTVAVWPFSWQLGRHTFSLVRTPTTLGFDYAEYQSGDKTINSVLYPRFSCDNIWLRWSSQVCGDSIDTQCRQPVPAPKNDTHDNL